MSGEDVDVRTLGSGRPFVVELVKPKVSRVSPTELANIQNAINAKGVDLIRVRNLEIIDKSDLDYLKEGEENKRKTYLALCSAKGEVKLNELDARLRGMLPLSISQKTPVRVLHRRPVATRMRLIYDITVETADVPLQLGETFFKLRMTTQAGTYVKEFVNGDFGRTSPNISEILNNIPIEVIALDVLEVHIEWPRKKRIPEMAA